MEEVKVSKEQSVAKREATPARAANDLFAPIVPFGRLFGMSPFALMREFTDEMDRVFRGVAPGMDSGAGLRAWSPAVDVRQCDGNLVVTAELPGLKKDEVKVELTEGALVIQGERKREHKEDHEGYHRWERSYGQFYRSIALPEGAKTDQIKAELQDGLLKVSVPVPQAEKKSRQIQIEAKTATAKA
ncbi:MAG: Hsp20/alpha crystallin family protein [Bryobacteraceae bacterium]|jgi:HSP20 family protein